MIRRGRHTSTPVTREKSTWGGLRAENVADLELSPGEELDLKPFERAVEEVADSVIGSAGGERLSNSRDVIVAHRVTNTERFQRFKAGVDDAVADQKWFIHTGLSPLIVLLVVFALTGGILLLGGVGGYDPIAPTWARVVMIALSICLSLTRRCCWSARSSCGCGGVAARRSRVGRALEAFRRFLSDFPRLQDAPPASLELWERYLVYGIAFGIAEQVLQAAQLKMPDELDQPSTVYVASPTGDLGSGPTALGIGDLSAAGSGSALAPPSSGSRGGRAASPAAEAAVAAAALVARRFRADAVRRGRLRWSG